MAPTQEETMLGPELAGGEHVLGSCFCSLTGPQGTEPLLLLSRGIRASAGKRGADTSRRAQAEKCYWYKESGACSRLSALWSAAFTLALSPPIWPLKALVAFGGTHKRQGGMRAPRKGFPLPPPKI